jgi:hypothetical protein
MNKRVMVATDFSCFRHMTGMVIFARPADRLVVLDIMPDRPMLFQVRELIWL